MQKLVVDIYHKLGSIKDKISELVNDENDETKKKELMDLSVDILDLRWLIATNLTSKEES